MPKKISISKLEDSGMLSSSYKRYRIIYAQYLKERRKKKPKLQAIHDAGEAKGASERTVYTAIKVCEKLK